MLPSFNKKMKFSLRMILTTGSEQHMPWLGPRCSTCGKRAARHWNLTSYRMPANRNQDKSSEPSGGYLWISPGLFYLSFNILHHFGKDQLSKAPALYFIFSKSFFQNEIWETRKHEPKTKMCYVATRQCSYYSCSMIYPNRTFF